MQHLFDGLFVKPGSLHSQQAVSGTGRVAPCAIQRKCFKQRNLFLVGHSYKLSLVLDFQPEISYTTEGIKITPHAKAEKKKALLPDEVDILMSVVVEPRARVFCALCLYCGLRKEEALGLQWSDIQSNSLTVRRAMTFLNNQQDPVDDLKTKAAHRVIPIPDKLRAILLDTPHLSRYIVPASNGGDMTRSAFTRMWNSHVVSLVPFPLHPHMLRHTYATTLYRARVDLRTAQKLMGHSSIQVTADIYTHLEQEDSLHVADKLNEYLSGKSENSVKSSQKVVKLAI